jgi:hypothetical protein
VELVVPVATGKEFCEGGGVCISVGAAVMVRGGTAGVWEAVRVEAASDDGVIEAARLGVSLPDVQPVTNQNNIHPPQEERGSWTPEQH